MNDNRVERDGTVPEYRLELIVPDGLDEHQKRRADVLTELIKIRWGQFNGRRDYEFKVTLSFWTALALAIAGVATQQQKPEFPAWFLIGLLVVAVLLHWHWCFSIRAISNIDRDSAFHWEKLLATKAAGGLPSEIQQKIDDWRHEPRDDRSHGWMRRLWNWCHRHGKRNWSHVFQVGVTALLTAALVILLWPPANRKSELEALQKQWLEADTLRILKTVQAVEPTKPSTAPALSTDESKSKPPPPAQ